MSLGIRYKVLRINEIRFNDINLSIAIVSLLLIGVSYLPCREACSEMTHIEIGELYSRCNKILIVFSKLIFLFYAVNNNNNGL